MVEDETTGTIRGEIVVPPLDEPVENAELVVQVEDVSRADAPSTVIAEYRQPSLQLRGGETLPFQLEVPISVVDPHHSYSVRVHIDVSGSGDVELGDFVSTQSYPVLTRGYGEEATVAVQRI